MKFSLNKEYRPYSSSHLNTIILSMFLLAVPVLSVSCGKSPRTQSDLDVANKLRAMGIGLTDSERTKIFVQDAYESQKRIRKCMNRAGFEYQTNLPAANRLGAETYFGIAARARSDVLAQGGGNTNADPAFNNALAGNTVGKFSPKSCLGKEFTQDPKTKRISDVLRKRFQDPRYRELEKRWSQCMKVRFGVKTPNRAAFTVSVASTLDSAFDLKKIDEFELTEKLAYSQYSECLTEKDRDLEVALLLEYGKRITN